MSVDENNAYRITERLAFPRLIGSEREQEAIDIVVDEFKKAGYETVHREKFMTSFYNWIVARYMFFPIAGFLMLLAISLYIHPFMTLGVLLGFLFVAAKALGMVNTAEIKLMKDPSKNYETENIFVELKSKNSKVKVVFMGHWDSKSQTFSSPVRVAIILTAALGGLLMLLVFLIMSIIGIITLFIPLGWDLSLLNLIIFYVCLALAIIGCLNYFNKTGNKSPGAIDNAASVATVVELARYFKENPLDNVDFIFISTSSEELNLGGAKDYIAKHKDEYDPKSSYFINFDTIGGTGLIRLITAYGIPRKSSSKKLNDLLLESSKELNIEAKVIYLPTGAWSDFMPIIQQGFESCWLASQGNLKYVHTTKDNMSIIDKQGLKNGLLLSIEVAKKLDHEFN